MTDIITETERTAHTTLPHLMKYFEDVSAPTDDQGVRIDRALKMLSIYSRLRATRANEAGIVAMMARIMGLSHEALYPLWLQLTGTHASGYVLSSAAPALAPANTEGSAQSETANDPPRSVRRRHSQHRS